MLSCLQERLSYLPEAPRDHRAKIDRYNELLEDVYQREVELSHIKSALLDMRQEITEDVRHLSTTGVLSSPIASVVDAAKSETESDEAENVLSDSSGDGSSGTGDIKSRRSSSGKPSVKGGRKVKRKFGRLGNRHSRVPDAQLDAEWDYRLDVGRGLGKKGRRGSDVSETDIPV